VLADALAYDLGRHRIAEEDTMHKIKNAMGKTMMALPELALEILPGALLILGGLTVLALTAVS
jgi:hypothetical protein